MGRETKIEWCDSTVNPTMGCDGCELWNRSTGVDHCYAGQLTDRYKGQKGFPASFDVPELFAGRVEQAVKWSDLTGTDRPDKPWLNGMPRLIFVGDMGDTFSESLGDPVEYLAPLVEIMAKSPHQWLMLTKRPSRMAKFSRDIGGLPSNVWPGTTVTSQRTLGRLDYLRAVVGGGPKWASFEPLLGGVDLTPILGFGCCDEDGCECENQQRFLAQWPLDRDGLRRCCAGSTAIMETTGLDWIIAGAESGKNARPCNPGWVRALRDQCEASGTQFFFKQWGAWVPYEKGSPSIWGGQDGTAIDCAGLPVGVVDHEEVDGWYWPCDPEHLNAIYRRSSKGKPGRLLDGQEHSGMPSLGVTP